jgi:hypothetical protein
MSPTIGGWHLMAPGFRWLPLHLPFEPLFFMLEPSLLLLPLVNLGASPAPCILRDMCFFYHYKILYHILYSSGATGQTTISAICGVNNAPRQSARQSDAAYVTAAVFESQSDQHAHAGWPPQFNLGNEGCIRCDARADFLSATRFGESGTMAI